MEPFSSHARRFETLITQVDPVSDDARAAIAALREQIDEAYERHDLTLAEWRALVELVTGVRSRCAGANDVRGNNGTTVTW